MVPKRKSGETIKWKTIPLPIKQLNSDNFFQLRCELIICRYQLTALTNYEPFIESVRTRYLSLQRDMYTGTHKWFIFIEITSNKIS